MKRYEILGCLNGRVMESLGRFGTIQECVDRKRRANCCPSMEYVIIDREVCGIPEDASLMSVKLPKAFFE